MKIFKIEKIFQADNWNVFTYTRSWKTLWFKQYVKIYTGYSNPFVDFDTGETVSPELQQILTNAVWQKKHRRRVL